MQIIVRKSQRDVMSPEHVPAAMRGRVSASARGYEEADQIVRRYDRRAEGGPKIAPVMIADERESDRVEIEGHARVIGARAAEAIVGSRKPRRRTYFV